MMDVNDIKPVYVKSVEDFVSQNPRMFYRDFIKIKPKYDVIVNNMTETFNADIVQAMVTHNLHVGRH